LNKKNFQIWRPELRRAVMKVQPEYFSWPLERREQYSASFPDEDREQFEAALQSELFGGSSSAEAKEAADHLADDELQLWNETILPFFGIGEDCFYLNEWFASDKTILEFTTLRDFDEYDYRFQEEARKNDDADYPGKPYRGSLYLNWARLFVDGKFTYATLSMAAGYLYSQLSNEALDLIEQRIPHRHVPGRNHGKTEGDNWQWDMRVDASGEEGILEELERITWKYLYERWDALLTSYDDSAVAGAYLLDESKPPEHNWHVVFTDKRALESIRLRNFLMDCRRLEHPSIELESVLEAERVNLLHFVDEQLAEIRRTWDPKVARLRKRRKVMVAKGAFDKL
jgi:hypothetical protein